MEASKGGDDGTWREEWGTDKPLHLNSSLFLVRGDQKTTTEDSNTGILDFVIHGELNL